jgi:hypothetical protein
LLAWAARRWSSEKRSPNISAAFARRSANKLPNVH